MGTVIQDQQRRNHDRHPHWHRPQRAARFAQYGDRQAQGLSQRQAAQALDVPRTTLQAWRAYQERLDAQPAVVAFFHSPPGLAFLHRLGLGIHLVWTAIGACGMRLVCLLVHRTGRDRFVGTSSGTQHQGNRQVEEAIVAYRREASARLAKDMPAKDLPVAKEATCTGGLGLVAMDPKSNAIIVAQAAQARDQDPWNALMEQALAGLTRRVMPSTRDEAPGLLAYGDHHLGAHHAPDLFHVQPALVKAVSGPMATTQRAAGKGATAAQEMLTQGQGPLRRVGHEPHKRRAGRPPKVPANLAQVTQEAAATRQADRRIREQRAQGVQSMRASGHADHFGD